MLSCSGCCAALEIFISFSRPASDLHQFSILLSSGRSEQWILELAMNLRRSFHIKEKVPTRAFQPGEGPSCENFAEGSFTALLNTFHFTASCQPTWLTWITIWWETDDVQCTVCVREKENIRPPNGKIYFSLHLFYVNRTLFIRYDVKPTQHKSDKTNCTNRITIKVPTNTKWNRPRHWPPPASQKCGQFVGLHRGVTGHFVCMHERAERSAAMICTSDHPVIDLFSDCRQAPTVTLL